ncbi:MAG: DUF1822 family protein [Cyanobacteria bacterium SBLK]|nr:DUF1822 family protein [Cyanobacteria bacterium SBLK]
MIANFKKLSEIYVDHLWLQFSTEAQDMAWSEARQYSNQVSRWTAYLNLLVLNSFIPYLRENISLDNSSLEVMFSDRLSQSQTWKSYLWEFFNGTIIQVGDIRLAIIPDDRAIADDLSIVKEWVDIPQFAADYYLGVQVDLEERWVRVWGYVTHQQVKEKAEYDSWDRTYLLDAEDAIADLNILWMARELGIQERGEYELKTLPSLADSQKNDLIAKWGQPSAYSPRLEVTDEEFWLWGALLWDNSGREELYERRRNITRTLTESEQSSSDVLSQPVEILQWIQKVLESICEVVEPLLESSEDRLIPEYRSAQSIVAYEGSSIVDLGALALGQQIQITQIIMPVDDSGLLDILIDVSAMNEYTSLPIALELQAFDRNNNVFLAAKVEENDANIRLEFNRKFKNPFGIRLVLENSQYLEYIYQ